MEENAYKHMIYSVNDNLTFLLSKSLKHLNILGVMNNKQYCN